MSKGTGLLVLLLLVTVVTACAPAEATPPPVIVRETVQIPVPVRETVIVRETVPAVKETVVVEKRVEVPAPTQAPPPNAYKLELYSPLGGTEVTVLHPPRLADLNGKTLCELSDDSWQAHRTFPALRTALQRQYPSTRIIPYTEFPIGRSEIDSDETADMVVRKKCQAVIVGNAG